MTRLAARRCTFCPPVRGYWLAGSDRGRPAVAGKRPFDAVTIGAVADDEATLRVLRALGAAPGRPPVALTAPLIAAAHLGHGGVVDKQRIVAQVRPDHVKNLHWTVMIETVMLGDGLLRHKESCEFC